MPKRVDIFHGPGNRVSVGGYTFWVIVFTGFGLLRGQIITLNRMTAFGMVLYGILLTTSLVVYMMGHIRKIRRLLRVSVLLSLVAAMIQIGVVFYPIRKEAGWMYDSSRLYEKVIAPRVSTDPKDERLSGSPLDTNATRVDPVKYSAEVEADAVDTIGRE